MKTQLFKKSLCIFLVVAFCLLAFGQSQNNITTVEAKTLSELEAQIKANQQKQKELSSLISSTKGDISKEKENQDAISEQIETTQAIINDLNTKIDALNIDIADTQTRLDEKQQEIIQGVQDFKARLKAMYLSGNDSYASILVGSTDFFDFLMKVDLIKNVAKYDDKTISDLITLKNNFEIEKQSLEDKKADLEASKSEYSSNVENLNSLYDSSATFIAQKQQEKANYEQMSAEKKAEEDKIQKEIDAEIEKLRQKDNAFVGGMFTWPLPGYTYISSPFAMRWGVMHWGIDITGANVYGKPIVAANSGKVIIAFTNDRYMYSYGKYVVIDHGGGYTTVYGHCSSLAVSVGQTVTKGQTIAYVGSTGYSTGAHLHFEIRENNVKKNPLNYFNKS